MTKVHIRWMIRRDMPEVLQIEQFSLHPQTEEDILLCLRQRKCIGMVAEIGGGEGTDWDSVIGYMIYELCSDKLHMLHFAVHPQHRRLKKCQIMSMDQTQEIKGGIGSAMLSKVMSKLRSHRRTHLTAAVRELNLGAQLFFHAKGLRAVKILRGEFENEDGYLFEYRLPVVDRLFEEVER